MYKNFVFVAVFLCCCFSFAFCPAVSAQTITALTDNNASQSIDVVKSLTNVNETELSLEGSVDEVVKSMTEKMDTVANTVESVKSAVDGTLVVEDVIPETNRNIVEAVDTKTKRYSPRLKMDFMAFPLRSLSGRIIEVVGNGQLPDLFEQTNSSITADIARRIQERLQIQDVNFEFNNRTAKLTGTVKTTRQRNLAEMMIRMEPGVDHVKNEIIVDNQ